MQKAVAPKGSARCRGGREKRHFESHTLINHKTHNPKEPTMNPIPAFLILLSILLFVSCKSDTPTKPVNSSYDLKIQIQSGDSILFNQNSKLKISLYSVSNKIADQAATNIKTAIFAIPSLPQTYDIQFDHSDLDKTDPKVGESGEFSYYICLDADINNDSLICRGDAIWDFDKTPFFTISESAPHNNSVTIFITLKADTLCIAF